MKRGFLRWFYIGVQFVMLAVSIPKVAMLFHAYDTETMGMLIAGLDIRSWMVGIAIDLTATFTTWAAMAKYDETRKRTALLAPGLIILCCTALSVVANYEDAATQAPLQYAQVSLFTHPALLINPALISAPPILVLLLVLLVPSVLARPRLKSAEEIAAEASEQEALIAAKARVREAKVKANAKVRDARLSGMADTASSLAKRAGISKDEPSGEAVSTPEPEAVSILPPAATPKMTKAFWKSLPIKERVNQSGLITPQEVSEVLSISLTRARELSKDAPESDLVKFPGRTGVSAQGLIDALYERRTPESFAQAKKLEKALGMSKRKLHVVEPEPEIDTSEETEVEA